MGNKMDLVNRTKDSAPLIAQVLTSTTSTTGTSKKGFRGTAHVINVGNSGDTLAVGLKWDIKIEESDALASGYANCVDADVIFGSALTAGVFDTIDAPAEDSKSLLIQYIGSKEFSRITFTATGTHSNGTPISVTALNVNSSHIPI